MRPEPFAFIGRFMKYIIMCGGSYDTWQTPKQLIEIRGEPIVMRTIRLLEAEGITDIAISTKDKRFERCGVPLLEHTNTFKVENGWVTGSWVEAFYPTDEPACYLFGDVVYSPEAIRTIANTDTDDIMFFASAPPFGDGYTKPWAEPFAFKVVNQKRFRLCIEKVKEYERAGMFRRNPIAWELWQVITGCELNHIDYKSYTIINDYTCDIDSPEDVRRIHEYLDRYSDERQHHD